MTVKTILIALLLATLGPQAFAQDPPPATATNAPSFEEVMRRARQETNSAGTNATATGPVATPVEAPAAVPVAAPTGPLPTAINRPTVRPRPILPAGPLPTPVAAPVAAPGLPAAQPLPVPISVPNFPATAQPGAGLANAVPHVSTAESIANPNAIIPAGSIQFSAAPLEKVLEIYAEYVGRNLLRPEKLPDSKIVLNQVTPLTKLEVVQAIEAALYLNNVSVVNVGDKFVTVVTTAEVGKIPGPLNKTATTNLADLGSILTDIVQLKYTKPSELMTVLTPFVSGTAASPIVPIDSSGILVLRDNIANVKRMLEMIEKVDVAVESEIVSEVIPIKFAKAEDIASALSSVGGGGGSTSIGSRPTGGGTTPGGNRLGGSGLGGGTGVGGFNQSGAVGGLGGAQAAATPRPSSGSSFNDRLRNIINKASASGEIQILGNTKIIADIRSNSLLVFATREDMKMIKDIVGKLDVVLAQVLIETLIMDVTIGNNWNFGVSVAQTPIDFNNNLTGAGGMNANKFFDFTGGSSTNAFGDLLGSGVKYFGKVNDDIYVSIAAAAADNKIKVIQRPRIQTSHATPASLFIGSTVPYVTSTYYGGGFGGGPSSSYQQLKVGIGLNVTPFINQDGLVVMQIDETIDELDGSTKIDGVGDVPNTKSSSLSAEIAVRDGESVILGGIVRNADSLSKGGVPYLKDIPLLGYLFRSTSSDKKRQESIVLMRPTVLRTPELAALQVDIEQKHMPGITEAASSMRREQDKAEAAEARRQQQELFNSVTPFTPEEKKLLNTSP
jgi:general secretion pathway protein D